MGDLGFEPRTSGLSSPNLNLLSAAIEKIKVEREQSELLFRCAV